MKSHDAQALRKVANWILKARAVSGDKTPGVCLVIGMDPERRIPKFEIEDAGPEQPGSDDLDAALAEARQRGVSRAVEILSRPDMLSAADFAKFIGVSREAVRAKHHRNEVLGLKGAKRGLRFPKWQITSNGGLLLELPQIFDALGGDSWTVYRFLTQYHPELEGETALSALQRGRSKKSSLPPKIPPAPFANLWLAARRLRDSNRAELNSRRSKQEPSRSSCIHRATPIRLALGSHQAGSAQTPMSGVCPSFSAKATEDRRGETGALN